MGISSIPSWIIRESYAYAQYMLAIFIIVIISYEGIVVYIGKLAHFFNIASEGFHRWLVMWSFYIWSSLESCLMAGLD